MTKLTTKTIEKLQKDYGFDVVQKNINTGMCWLLEGHYGREAMALLDSGACMLPKVAHRDYYGNRIPSRDDLKVGTKGTFKNTQNFWEGVLDGSIEIDPLETLDEE